MASIADLFAKLVLDDTGFEASVVKSAGSAADKASQTMGQRVSTGLKSALGAGLKVGGAALAGGLAIATKGVVELENVTASFRAETGATAEEAQRAGEAINAMAGRNLQPLNEIGATMSKVTTDLGLTGDAAAQTTEAFLKFGRATGQDTTSAVAALDDILDGFGLTAADSQGIMDKLVVSHQRYGGSITENQAALSKMAPQLQALNLNVDDGIGLLNLFAASGLDASAGQKALNSAIAKLPPGESLDQFVQRLSMVTDDGERARQAMVVFGAKAGAGLANAIKPGMAGLASFQVSTEEATGATIEAADALDGTFGNRLKLLMKGATSALTGFGASFGPALTGLASLSSLAATLGGGRLLKPLGGLGGKIAASLGPAISDGIANAVAGVQANPKFIGATDKLGSFMGSRLGKGLSVAFAAVAVFEVIETYRRINDELNAQLAEIGVDAAKQIISGTTEQLTIGRDATAKGLQDIYNLGAAGVLLYGDQITTLKAQLADYNAAIDRSVSETESSAAAAAAGVPAAVSTALEYGTNEVTQAAQHMVSGVPGAISGAAATAGKLGGGIPGSLADAILAKQDEVGNAMDALTNQIKNQDGRSKRIGQYIGYLIGDELIGGLNKKRAGVRDAARKSQEVVTSELVRLIQGGGRAGKDAMRALNQAIKNGTPAQKAAALRVKAIIEKNIKPKTKPIIKDSMTDVKTEINSGKGPVGGAAYNLGQTIGQRLLAGLQTLRNTPGGKYNESEHRAHGGPVTAGQPYIVGERRPELFVPSVSGRIIPNLNSVSASAGGGGDTYNIPVNITGVLSARTPDDVARPLRALANSGVISAPRHRQLVRVPNG